MKLDNLFISWLPRFFHTSRQNWNTSMKIVFTFFIISSEILFQNQNKISGSSYCGSLLEVEGLQNTRDKGRSYLNKTKDEDTKPTMNFGMKKKLVNNKIPAHFLDIEEDEGINLPNELTIDIADEYKIYIMEQGDLRADWVFTDYLPPETKLWHQYTRR